MKHDQLSVLGGALEGLKLPTEASQTIPGTLHMDGRFLTYRDSAGESQSVEIMDGNDYVEWISYLGRAASNNLIVNQVTGVAASTAVSNVNPKINPYYAVSSNTQQMRAYADLNTNITTGDFTFEAWRRANTLVGDESYPHDIFTSSNQATHFRFAFRPPGYWWLECGADTIVTPRGENLPPVNEWHHVAVEREGTTLRLYLNGRVIFENTYTVRNISMSRAVFGAQYSQNQATCHLDEIVLTRVAKYAGANFIPKNKPIILIP